MSACVDEPLWHNGHNATCATYMQSAMCVNGALAPSASWASGAAFNWPERNCCGCGLAAALTASPPPPIGDGATTHGYTLHLGTYCRGADRTTKKDSAGACEAHASSRKVACAHFGGGVCRFTYTFLGLLKAESSGFQSFVRPGAADDKAALKAAAAEEAKAKAALTASVSPLQACGPPTPRVPPSFYMYDGPEFMWGERLAACYATKFGRSPWSMPTLGERGMPVRRSNSSDAAAGDSIFLPAAAVRASGATLLGGGGGGGAFSPASAGGSRIGPVPPLGGGLGAAAPPPGAGGGGGKGTVFGAGSAPAPHADLSHALWLHSALSGHRRRVREPDGAALFVVPAFGSLSEATGSCEGTTHTQRMTAAANALRASPHWMKAKERHVVFAGSSSEDRLPLGDLGAVLSKGNAIGLCTSRTYCSARFAKRAEVPMLPLLSLMDPKLPGKLGGELCAKGSQSDGGGKRRRTLLFFRGAHGTSTPAQQVRARLWELKSLGPNVDIKFTTGGASSGTLDADVRQRLVQKGWNSKDVRMPYNVEAAAYGMLHSDFCALPRGEGSNPGRRLVDAVAAGCVPVLIGDTLRPPLGAFLKYPDFTVRVPEAEFLRFPKGAVAEALEKAVPRLPELRRGLLRARQELLLGNGVSPLEMSPTKGADLVLLQAGRVFCPRTPASFRACEAAAMGSPVAA